MSGGYLENYNSIKWTKRKAVSRLQEPETRVAYNIIKDIEPFQSPVDGSYVTSRSELREHEKKHNVRQTGNDWTGSERPSNWDKIRNVHN